MLAAQSPLQVPFWAVVSPVLRSLCCRELGELDGHPVIQRHVPGALRSRNILIFILGFLTLNFKIQLKYGMHKLNSETRIVASVLRFMFSFSVMHYALRNHDIPFRHSDHSRSQREVDEPLLVSTA